MMKIRKQDYQQYTEVDQQVWKILFDRQMDNLGDKACSEYLSSLEELQNSLKPDIIPDFNALDHDLMAATGWSIEVVDGLIPVVDFFELLAMKRFCSSTWLRKKSQLEYLEEPDMFHDIFGHVPLLVNENYSNFMQKFGEIGFANRANPDYVRQLQRLYWYTIEFGLLNENGHRKIFGAGILSSSKESSHIYDPDIVVYPYDIKTIMQTEFTTSEIQECYFEVDSYKQLYESLFEL